MSRTMMPETLVNSLFSALLNGSTDADHIRHQLLLHPELANFVLQENPRPLTIGDSTIEAAIVGGNLNNLRILFENGANADKANPKGNTCLHFLCSYNKLSGELPLKFANIILEQFPDEEKRINFINKKNQQGSTAMHDLCTGTKVAYPLFQLLLENGGDPSIVDDNGDTVLHVATRYNRVKIVKDIVNKFDEVPWPTLVNNNGNSTLHAASSNGYDELVRFFLMNGWSQLQRNHRGKSVRDLATNRYNVLNALNDTSFFTAIRTFLLVVHRKEGLLYLNTDAIDMMFGPYGWLRQYLCQDHYSQLSAFQVAE
eukprot:NODE_4353_length_1182_cov_41.783758_g3844_i0.p1 GENE.NODE_4353_length_1182_cov_41.783758_g3844_i0~~NODE_4353_length_1182_cov_41.783758_g3844_i0.p1  ORF type:complete len:313 (-),score=42.04 NODE_4353_length_1182_cov_41.783758_g3844_i0:205-1143(-)